VIAPSDLDAVIGPLRRLFVDERGAAVPVDTRSLGPDEAAPLFPAGRDDLVVVLPGADALAALVPGEAVTAAVAVANRDAAVLVYATTPVTPLLRDAVAALGAATGALAGDLGRLRTEAAALDALNATGRGLTAHRDMDRVVQDATDAAVRATGASFGAFFYNLVDEYGESYTLYTISGVPRELFERFPMPRNTAVFAPTFDGTGTVRSDDIRADPRFGRNPPYNGMPEGHLPVVSYLAVSVVSPTSGEVIGGFFFGHSEEGRFTARHAGLAEGIARYAAIALDNARLFDRERNLAAELSQSMIPVVPDIDGLRVAARYMPATTGVKVGGDWYDVIALPSGRTAFVIGDVVGHGVPAATLMAQMRTGIRSYAQLDMPPGEVLRHVSQLMSELSETGFATCIYAVHGADGTLTFASAGHPPAVLVHPDGGYELIGESMARPLGLGDRYPEATVPFPPGSELLLYTDGLVESRTRDLTDNIRLLAEEVAALHGQPDIDDALDRIVGELTGGGTDDDVALIHVRNAGA
jgi:serine phosphatase RsbU (regulator of sigma subunit)